MYKRCCNLFRPLSFIYRSKSTVAEKSLSDIPGPFQWPIVGSMPQMLRNYGTENMHKLMEDRAKQYGKIYFESFGSFGGVFVSDPKFSAIMTRTEGRYPERYEHTMFKHYREKRGIPLTVFLSEGEQWQRMRTAIQKQLMTLSNVYRYVPILNAVAEDFIKLVTKNQGEIPDLDQLLFDWSTEAVCAFLFDQQLGMLSENRPEDLVQFQKAVDYLFTMPVYLLMMNPTLVKRFFSKRYREIEAVWDVIFDHGRKRVEHKLKLHGNEKEESFVGSLLAQGLTQEEIVSTCIELFGAGIDTTSNTMLWLLHMLALNPEAQEKIHVEVRSNVKSPQAPITSEALKKSPYLKAAVKESMRLHPVAPGNARKMAEDATMGEYRIPKGTWVQTNDYVMGRSEDYFDEPLKFKPERWMREGEKADRFATNPFGFGPRSCVGRRLVETEMYVFVARLLNDFTIIDHNGKEVEGITKLIFQPREKIRIELRRRPS